MWVSRHPLNNSLVVFIHGLTGSRWHTWRSYVDLFQAIATGIWPKDWPPLPSDRRRLLGSFDVYLFNYETRALRQAPLERFVTELKAFVDTQSGHYDTIVLVGHSQGGLLGKLYILSELADGHGQTMKIDRIITMNTPHYGARFFYQPAMFLGFPLRLVSIRGKSPLRQFLDLTSISRNIRFLRKNWNENTIPKAGTPSTPTTRHIMSIALRTRGDLLVSHRSANGSEVDKQVSLTEGGGHSVDSIPVAFRLGESLAEHLDPLEVEKQLDAIYADTGRTSLFRRQLLGDAVTTMQGKYPFFANRYLIRKAGCLVDEFPRALKRRPLRNLDLSAAFQTYVRKVLDI